MLLAGQLKYRSTDAAELEHFMKASGGVRDFDIANGGTGLSLAVNIAGLQDVELVNVSANVENSATYEPVDFVRQCYLVRGRANGLVAKQEFRGTSSEISSNYGLIVPNGTPWQVTYGPQFESLALRIRPQAIERVLTHIAGSHLSRPVEFEQTSSANAIRLTALRNAVFQFANELGSPMTGYSQLAWAEIEHALIVRFLLCNRHNYSYLFLQDEPAIGTSQIQRVEDYIATHWDKQLDVGILAAIAGSSARTLFRCFQKRHGCSPYAFVKMVRLDQARLLLLNGKDGDSVIAIALKCGFHSLGHFAKSYQVRFGELPSQTLRQSRIGSSSLN